MMPDDLTSRSARFALAAIDDLAEAATLTEIAFDCIAYESDNLQRKLQVLLGCIQQKLEYIESELPYRIRVLVEAAEQQGGEGGE